MQNNQNTGSSQGGQEKPKPTLSWAQPQQNAPRQKLLTAQPKSASGEKRPMKPRTMFVIGLIVGILATWVWFSTHASRPQPAPQDGNGALSIDGASKKAPAQAANSSSSSTASSPSSASPAGTMTNDSLEVPTPQNAGTSVAVSSITADGPVWAVVYEDNNGKVGNALGAARFTPPHTEGTIELLRTTLPNLTYFVGLTADTPDHTFSIKTNAPILDQSGNQVMTQFAAQ